MSEKNNGKSKNVRSLSLTPILNHFYTPVACLFIQPRLHCFCLSLFNSTSLIPVSVTALHVNTFP